MAKVKDRSDSSMPPLPYKEPETIPNPNAKDQSSSGYPANWLK